MVQRLLKCTLHIIRECVEYVCSSEDSCSLDSQAVADIIRTTLGPRSMLKMLLDANGGELTHYALASRLLC